MALSSLPIFSLSPPPNDWVVDSGSLFHITPYPRVVSLPHPYNPTSPFSILVGNGSTLYVTSIGDTVLPGPLNLNNILVVPNIIQNLLSVCHYTTDNRCSMEFDPWGLTTWDLTTRVVVARCDSSGPSTPFAFPLPRPTFLRSCCPTLRP
jgi:hypothetical protein